jgi:hypothetical protein
MKDSPPRDIVIVRDDDISPSRVEIGLAYCFQCEYEKCRYIEHEKYSEHCYEGSCDASHKSEESDNNRNDGEWRAGSPYDREVVCLDAHAELIWSDPVIEVESSFIDLLSYLGESRLSYILVSEYVGSVCGTDAHERGNYGSDMVWIIEKKREKTNIIYYLISSLCGARLTSRDFDTSTPQGISI